MVFNGMDDNHVPTKVLVVDNSISVMDNMDNDRFYLVFVLYADAIRMLDDHSY